jgi:hypothetical protein
MNIPLTETALSSPQELARLVGILGLCGILTGAFDIGYVQRTILVSGDAGATLHNIFIHQRLFRLGFSAHLLELVINILGEVIAFFLLRRVNMIIAGISLCCGFVGIAIEAVDLLNAWLPFKLATATTFNPDFNPQHLHSLFNISLQMQQAGLLLSWVFYGVDELASGILFFRSRFIPRILGLMLALSGICYFTHGFLSFLAPSLDNHLYPYILFPCLPGEGLSSLWLTFAGLNMTRWKEWGNRLQKT